MKLYKQCEGTARAWIQAAVAMLWLAAGCSTPSYIDPKDPLLTAYQPHSTSLLRHTAADIREAAPHKEAFEQFLNSKSGGDDQLTYRERLSLDHDRHLKIAALDKLLLTAEKSKKPELYLQLAEAHRLRHDFLYETAVNRYLIAREHKTGAGEEPPTLNLEEAQAELLQSADALRSFVRDFPNHEKTQEASLALARALGRTGNDNASFYYDMVQKRKPGDAVQAEIWTAQAEEAFDRADLKTATKYYKQAITLKGTPAYPYAVYKLGWTYVLTGLNDPAQMSSIKSKAHAAFALVVKLGEGKDAAPALAALRTEAIFDQCLWWGTTGGMESGAMENYLAAQGHSELYPVYLVHRARALVAQKNFEQAIELYKKLLASSRPLPEWVDYYAELVDSTFAAGMDNNVYRAMEDWQSNLKASQGPWAELFARVPTAKSKAESLFASTLSAYAARYLDKAQKDGGENYLGLSEKLYRLKLTLPGEEKQAATHFNMGLIEFQKGAFDAAQKEFQTSFDLTGAGDKIHVDSAYNRLATLVKLEEKTELEGGGTGNCLSAASPQSNDQTSAKKNGETGIKEDKKRLIAALDDYLAVAPAEKRMEVLPLRFNCAMAMMTCGPKAEALQRFEGILLESPKSTQGKSSFSAIFSYLIDQNNWEEVAKLSEKYLGSDKLKGKGFDSLLKGLLAQANEQKGKPK